MSIIDRDVVSDYYNTGGYNKTVFINKFNDLEIINVSNNHIKIVPNLLQFKNLDFENIKIDWINVLDLQGMKGYQIIKNIILNMKRVN